MMTSSGPKWIIIIPEQAPTGRNDRTGVFVVIEKDSTVRWKHIVAGITEGGFVQVDGLWPAASGNARNPD
ncbi:MAG: hypothetical protein ABIK15_06585 [Pseudomonadota bacterium]